MWKIKVDKTGRTSRILNDNEVKDLLITICMATKGKHYFSTAEDAINEIKKLGMTPIYVKPTKWNKGIKRIQDTWIKLWEFWKNFTTK